MKETQCGCGATIKIRDRSYKRAWNHRKKIYIKCKNCGAYRVVNDHEYPWKNSYPE